MTETEWLNCTDPEKMLFYLRPREIVSDRKGRLIACGCCRRLWNRLDGEWQSGREVIEIVERFVDGSASEIELRAAKQAYAIAHHRSHHRLGRDDPLAPIRYLFPDSRYSGRAAMDSASKAARFVIRKKQRRSEYSFQASLFRDVLGNPFRPVAVDPTWLAWNDGIVRKLAQSIYNDRAFDRLPVLADALEEAGCTDADILAHCREPGEHVRGCWVVDLILGKE